MKKWKINLGFYEKWKINLVFYEKWKINLFFYKKWKINFVFYEKWKINLGFTIYIPDELLDSGNRYLKKDGKMCSSSSFVLTLSIL